MPAVNEPLWFRSEGSDWSTNARPAELVRDAKYRAEMLHGARSEGEQAPTVEIVSRIATQDRAIDFSKPGGAARRCRGQSRRSMPKAPTWSRSTDW